MYKFNGFLTGFEFIIISLFLSVIGNVLYRNIPYRNYSLKKMCFHLEISRKLLDWTNANFH